jgi:glycosyltransferase involved in cell wall biosynthesis
MMPDALDSPPSRSGRSVSVLQAHNLYRSNVPSGENDTVDLLGNAYRAAGATVTTFTPSSDTLAMLSAASTLRVGLRPLGSKNEIFRATLREADPDVLIVHNVYPYISPSDLRHAQRRGVPVVHVVHNYRHSCLAGTHFRDGQLCTSCARRRFAGPGVRGACYRDSTLQSSVMALSNGRFYRFWRDLDAYIAVSAGVADYLVAEGFPSDRVHVIPNPVAAVPAPSVPTAGVLYAGRLERQKGVELLLDAWELVPAGVRQCHRLNIAGDGDLRDLVQARSRSDPSVVYHGLLKPPALAALASHSAVTVIPSIWNEPFGRGAVEALLREHAVVVTDRGALADIVADGAGWVVRPHPHALSAALVEALASDNGRRTERGRAIAMRKYGLESVGERYLQVFYSVLGWSP